jgi:hypothetical protein
MDMNLVHIGSTGIKGIGEIKMNQWGMDQQRSMRKEK